MADTLNDYAVTNQWTNIVDTIAGAASIDVVLQCTSPDLVQVVQGGASAPTGKTGVVLQRFDSVQVNSANIWVKNFDGNGATLSVNPV